MATSDRKLEDLKQKIKTAFADVLYPKEKISGYDNEEGREIEAAFSNNEWKTIKPQILNEYYDIIPLLSPEAFHFFLPAYLLYSLDHFSGFETTTEFTIYAVTPTKSDVKDSLEYWKQKFEKFNSEQMMCIYEFLDLVKEDENFELFFEEVEIGKQVLEGIYRTKIEKINI